MKYFWFLVFLGICFPSFSQKDSLAYWQAGPKIEYFSYGSIDEIFTPYIYSGAAPRYGVSFDKLTGRSKHEFQINFSAMQRKPMNLNVPEFYYTVSYDGNKLNKSESEQIFRQVLTYFIHFDYSYSRKLNFHLHRKDKFYIGFNNGYSFIYRRWVEDPEIFSVTLSPQFFYQIPVVKDYYFSLKSNLTLLSLNLRKPYSGTTGQLYDNFDYDFYFQYVKDNYRINFINDLFSTTSVLKLEKSFFNSMNLGLFYEFFYQQAQKPRKLTSVSNSVGLTFLYKFGKHAKK